MLLSAHATCQALQSILILILIPWSGNVQGGELIFLHFLPVSVTGQRDKCCEISQEAVNMRQFNLCSSALMRSLVVMLGTGGNIFHQESSSGSLLLTTMACLLVRICHNHTGGSVQVIHERADNRSTSDTSLPQLSTSGKDPHWSKPRGG